MAQALELGLEFTSPTGHWPAHVWRATRTAYAAHFRALMEFFHDMRPTWLKPSDLDWILSDFLPTGVSNPFRGKWARRERMRFTAADKLVGHLSKGRRLRQHSDAEWGGPQDHAMILSKIRTVFRLVPQAAPWFPKTARILKRCPNAAA